MSMFFMVEVSHIDVFQIREMVFLKNTVMECEACGESD